jgi:formylglycine-generating enzyme required for sulfatase activity
MPCGPGFTRAGARCCPTRSASIEPGICVHQPVASCPAPLILGSRGCDSAERDVVEVPAMTVTVGPSDWEAEGRVRPRTVKVEAFAIDRLEVTVQKACDANLMSGPPCDGRDPARAAFGINLASARMYCHHRGGRLPTDDEWLAAAGGDRPRRYPWGDTGAVCRRAAWGLASGPCGDGASGPDTVGAHPDGVTPLGIHDLAGNVSEWVETPCPDPSAGAIDPLSRCTTHFVRGGSWKTTLATELRTWLRREVAFSNIDAPDPTVGFRCAYPPSAPSP